MKPYNNTLNEFYYSINMRKLSKLQEHSVKEEHENCKTNFPLINQSKPIHLERAISAKRLKTSNSAVNVISLNNFNQFSKEELLSETLRLKNEVNFLNEQISRIKAECTHQSKEINSKEKSVKTVEKVENEHKEVNKLKYQKQIFNLKNFYKTVKIQLDEQKLKNDKLRVQIHERSKIPQKRKKCEQKIEKIKDSTIQYLENTSNNKVNEEYLNNNKCNIDGFKNGHSKLLFLQQKISEIKEENTKMENIKFKNNDKISKLKRTLDKLKKENYRLNYELKIVQEQKKEFESSKYEREILEKKIRNMEEDFIKSKEKLSNLKSLSSSLQQRNEEIEKYLASKKKEKVEIKVIDYKKIRHIEPCPKDNPKICLLKSLINESKKKQKEYSDIISMYNDYSNQKQMLKESEEEEKETNQLDDPSSKGNELNKEEIISKEEIQKKEKNIKKEETDEKHLEPQNEVCQPDAKDANPKEEGEKNNNNETGEEMKNFEKDINESVNISNNSSMMKSSKKPKENNSSMDDKSTFIK